MVAEKHLLLFFELTAVPEDDDSILLVAEVTVELDFLALHFLLFNEKACVDQVLHIV